MKNSDSSPALLRVAVYIRVSSEEQAQRGDSVRDQKERAMRYIEDHKNMTLQDIYLDDGVSGQKIDRDDFTRLMNQVKAGMADLIIFTKLDRWFRSLRHYLNTQAVLEAHHTAWTAIDQPYFDTSTPYGRAFVAQSMTWAELEAQNGGLRVADVFKTKVEHGEVITGKVPRGYRIENKRMILSGEAPAIRDCLLYFLKYQSMNKTLFYMKDRYGITMTLPNFRQTLLRNEKLTGRYRENPRYCPRLLSDGEFQEIQEILDRNINIRSSEKYPYMFSGLLICEECGCKMACCHINVLSKRKDGRKIRYRYPAYQCKHHRAAMQCPNSGEIREARIEEYLLQAVHDTFCSCTAAFESAPLQMESIHLQEKQLQKKIERLKVLYLNEAITLEEFKADRSRCDDQLDRLRKEQSLLPGAAPRSVLTAAAYSDFPSLYQLLTPDQKRLFWRSVIQEIRITKSTDRSRTFTIFFL